MKVYHSIDQLASIGDTLVTMGTFDGLHVGHRVLIQQALERADQAGLVPIVVTFWPHPRLVLPTKDGYKHKVLMTKEEKMEVLQELGVPHLLIIPFDLNFSKTTHQDFVLDTLLDGLNMKEMVVGHDHQFGKGREGNFESLSLLSHSHGFKVHKVEPVSMGGELVSSSKIREALLHAQINKANLWLSRYYKVSGTVVKGQQLGRTLGYPTANIDINDEHKLLPSDGIYAVEIEVLKQNMYGLASLGFRPTVGGTYRLLEVNVLDFNSDLYGEDFKTKFIHYLRPELKFDSLDSLVAQMKQDELKARSLLNMHVNNNLRFD